ILTSLATNDAGWENLKGDYAEAIRRASAGYVVIAGAIAPGHGHVVIVSGDPPDPERGYPRGWWGSIATSGGKIRRVQASSWSIEERWVNHAPTKFETNGENSLRLSGQAFSQSDLQNKVQYYALRPKGWWGQ